MADDDKGGESGETVESLRAERDAARESIRKLEESNRATSAEAKKFREELQGLKKQSGSATATIEEWQKRAEEAEKRADTAEGKVRSMTFESSLKDVALPKVKPHMVKHLPRLIDVATIETDENGNFLGVDKAVDRFLKENPDYAVQEKKPQGGTPPVRQAGQGNGNGQPTELFNAKTSLGT